MFNEQDRELLYYIKRELDALWHHINHLDRARIAQMALDFTTINSLLDTISSDMAKNAADIQTAITQLGNVSGSNPADQAAIDAVVARLQGMKTSIEANNASLESAETPPVAAPASPPAQ